MISLMQRIARIVSQMGLELFGAILVTMFPFQESNGLGSL